VKTFILRHGIETELTYEVEATILDLLEPRVDNRFFATWSRGRHQAKRGLADAAVVASLYEVPRAPKITVPAMLIKILDLWTRAMSVVGLNEAIRHWRIGKRCNRAKYVFLISHGVRREVCAVESWRQWTHEEVGKEGMLGIRRPRRHRRWRTTATPATRTCTRREQPIRCATRTVNDEP
jgi:hypothetical protein